METKQLKVRPVLYLSDEIVTSWPDGYATVSQTGFRTTYRGSVVGIRYSYNKDGYKLTLNCSYYGRNIERIIERKGLLTRRGISAKCTELMDDLYLQRVKIK